MVRKRGEPNQHSMVLERRNPIADGLRSLRRRRPYGRPNFLQSATRGFRNAGKVFINIPRRTLAFPRRTPTIRAHFLHVAMLRKAPAQVYAPILCLCRVPPLTSSAAPAMAIFGGLYSSDRIDHAGLSPR